MKQKFKIGQKVICKTGLHNSHPNTEHACTITSADDIFGTRQYGVTRDSDGEKGAFNQSNIREAQ